jgi:capsular exopolysaccharide synthesis family protein
MGKRVLLIDVDMRNPSVHSLFKIDKAPGLSDYLLDGDMPLVHIQETQANNVSVMSAGTSVPNPAELLMSQRMSSFIKKMRENEVFIILDAPPVMMLSDTLNLASLVDGVVIVVKSSVTPCATIQKAVQQLEQINAKLVGAVLNKHNISRESYYNRYYYRDYHYYLKGNKRERAKAV